MTRLPEPWIDHDEGVRVVPKADGSFDYIPLDDRDLAHHAWFIEATDSLPDRELVRQSLFLSRLANQAPGVHAIAIVNGGKRGSGAARQAKREGLHRGALDLILLWSSWRQGRVGVFFAEFKNGKAMPSTAQVEELDRLHRMGFPCGVYRQPNTLLKHLRAAGAPFITGAITREGRL